MSAVEMALVLAEQMDASTAAYSAARWEELSVASTGETTAGTMDALLADRTAASLALMSVAMRDRC